MLELVLAQSRERPSAVAVVDGARKLTYSELDTWSGRLAARLEAARVQTESVVGVAVPRSLEAVLACLAVWRAGGAYLPLDPDDPPARLRQLVTDAAASVVVTSATATPTLPSTTATVLVTDGDAGAPRRQGEAVAVDQLAYVMYTSGSTGVPKGVGVTHAGVARLVTDQSFVKFGADRVVAFAAPLAFDASTFEIWGTLAHGGRLVVVSDRVPSPEVLARLVREEGLTTAWLTASLFNLVMDEHPSALSGLEELLVGGEALSVPHVRMALESLPGTRLVNGYGPTECTTFTTTHPVAPDHDARRAVPIGRPIAHTVVRVLDENLEPVGVGSQGELYVGGPGLARGYLGAPAATAERFVPDPYAERPGARLYRTGDLVRPLGDGTLDFVGRADHQVKLRGHRVEPGEVEAVLRASPGVVQAAVVVHGEGSRRAMTAFVATASGSSVDAGRLHDHLRERLPAYLVPNDVVVLPALPLTSSCKLDRVALTALATGRRDRPERRPAERGVGDAVEEAVAAIWAEVLGRTVAELGLHDDFLLVGGNSLLAVQVLSRLHERLGVDVSFTDFLRSPTIAGVARTVATAAPARPLPALTSQGDTDALRFPCSFAQERMWFIERLVPGTPVYNIPVAVRLTGPLDAVALQAALDAVIRRHAALRATFTMEDGGLVQCVSGGGAHLSVLDLSGLDAEAREAEAQRAVEMAASEPFDLATGPLLRGHLVRLGPREHILVIVVHHIVADAWSIGLVLRDLSAAYRARRLGAPSSLAPAALHYPDVARIQRATNDMQAFERDRGYWLAQLSGLPLTLELPADRPRPPVTSLRGAAVRFDLPDAAYKALKTLARDQGATPFSALLAVFHLLLHRYSGQDDVLVGLAVANRASTEVEGVVGPFVNMVVTHTTYGARTTFRSVLDQLQERLLDAYDHATLPFERLVECLAPERDPGRHPVVQAFFALPGDLGAGLDLPDIEAQRIPLHPGAAQMDVSLTVEESDLGAWASLEFATDLFEEATARRMASHLVALLEAVVADPDAALSSLPLGVVDGGSRPATARPSRALPVAGLHELVAAQAARTPTDVALVADDRSCTYAELDAASNQLAHHLRTLGVAPDVPVGVMVPRGVDMVVALLGILKAGGACVPLDPDYPRQRLEYMLGHAAAPVVLATTTTADVLGDECGARRVMLDADADAIAAQPESPPAVAVDGANLAYVLYTSGSTGVPKGVALEHRNLVSYFVGLDELLGEAGPRTWLATTSISFDMSLTELLWPLTQGERVVVGESLRRLRGRSGGAHGLVVDEVDVVQCTPTMARVLLADEDAAVVLRDLDVMILSGEEFPVDLYRSLRAATGGQIWNVYAPSETAVWSTAGVVDDVPGERIPVGAAMVNESVVVLDDRLHAVPTGAWGEVFIGGQGVSRGYLRRPRETAERFLPDPFGPPGARMYRSGDRGRLLPDGRVELHGRMDRQVQLRGNRVELPEIEAVLDEHPSVRSSVVAVRDLGGHDRRLVAYVEGDDVTVEELRDHARRRLPAYMVPSDVMVLRSFPLTPSGKVDRNALPLPRPAAPARRPVVASGTTTERVVAEVWQQVLALDAVGPDENFFDVGGNSFLVLQVLAGLRERVDRVPRVVDLFRYPTVRLLAAHLDRLAADMTPATTGGGAG